MQIAVGSSIQIALFVIPFMVTLGWCIGKPLSLLFDPFESIVSYCSILTQSIYFTFTSTTLNTDSLSLSFWSRRFYS